ncbi:MAG: transcriptional repressor [Eubacteriales bacterium]|nr:transcriptional repressor [Eubacteriales bacterium]
MAVKAQYRTKQMLEILTYLESVQGDHVTASDICGYFREKGIHVGTTTVYRHLERMVGQGLVAKYTVDGTSSACFEYLGEGHGRKDQTCYHCKCEKCGKVVHLHCGEVESLRRHIQEHHGFSVNSLKTVFYGICQACREDPKGPDARELKGNEKEKMEVLE